MNTSLVEMFAHHSPDVICIVTLFDAWYQKPCLLESCVFLRIIVITCGEKY